MNKLIPFVLIFLFSAFMAAGLPDLIALDSEWVDEYGQPIGNSVSVYQGETVEYYMMIVTDSDVIGYKVWLTQNGHAIDTIIPHTNIDDNHYFAYEEIDTSSYAPGDYTVKVGANNDGIENAYDETRYLYLEILPIQDENEPPYAPSNPSPVDGQTAVGIEGVMLVWTGGDPDGDAVTYDVLFGADGELMTQIAEGISETYFWHDENLDYETSYNWMVVAHDSEFDVVGPEWGFTTRGEIIVNEPPYRPSNPNPVDEATEINTNVVLSWTGGDPDGDAVTYDLWFAEEGELMELVGNDLTETSYYMTNLDYETEYIWGIIASDGELLAFGPEWSFTTREEGTYNEAPYRPNYLNPAYGAEGVETSVTLIWEGSDPDGDVLHYDVYFGTESHALDLIAEDLDMESYLIENLEFETEYFWMIVSKDSEFETAGYVWSFTTREEDVEENHDPVIENIENQRAKCNRNFRLWVDVDDEDNDDLTFYDNTDLFDIDSETGEISFKPDCSDRGTYYITITVVDEHGGEDSETFRLRIYRESSDDDDDDDDGDNIESVIEYGECIDDNDGDSLGVRQVIYTLLDSNSGGFISVQSSQEICQLVMDEIPVYEFKGFLEDELVTVILVIIIFLMITIPLALYVFSKLS
jgi:hypothetical protein